MRMIAAVFALLSTMATASWAQVMSPPVRQDWCAKAESYLQFQNDRPFSCAAANPRNLRCVKMNNYGCLQQPRRVAYHGTIWGNFTRGARDQAGHAIFDTPVASVVGIMNVYLRYIERGTNSALAISERYSPWCDTLGTVTRKTDRQGRYWYQTCRAASIPVGALRCARPASGRPSPGQCDACNCPSEVANRMLAGTGITDINAPLPLFNSQTQPTETLIKIIANKMVQEMGFRPTASLLQEGKDTYRPQRW